jgi:ribonuclease Y
VHRIEEEAREEAGARARRLVIEAIQRIPARDVLDNVVTLIRLPNDEMKGRVIGREGRNIRAFEMATGVDLIIDETPQVILLSSFDPLRRAVAQMALERLLEDGRIHPARIEETVTRARDDIESGFEPGGEAAAFALGITGLHPRLTRLLGRLRYRVIQGYNLLDHSLAVARTGAGMATLLGIPPDPLKRAGLLHEIGHAEEDDASLHPLLVGADLLAKVGEDARVVEAIRALHTAVAEPSTEAILLRAAENLVLNRPGERDDHLMSYVERLQQLEEVAGGFSGVQRAYAMRAGKEVRVIVEAARVADEQVGALSRDIATRIEKDVKYPGSIKVSVIRETRAVDYAT